MAFCVCINVREGYVFIAELLSMVRDSTDMAFGSTVTVNTTTNAGYSRSSTYLRTAGSDAEYMV